MPLLNVRLDAEDAQRVADLRRQGVQISQLVRNAIRAEHDERGRARRAGQTAATIVARIHQDDPDPPGARPRTFDLRDRRAVRAAVAARARRRRA